LLKPPTPLDETARLFSLHSLRILDTPSEERFDRITRMAKRVFGVDICLVSLVDAHRQWFKSRQGLDACETSREISFCGHSILDESVFVVEDAAKDVRFADNPLVTGDPQIRFYAGCPLHGPDRHRIGTLCIIDRRPRTLSKEDEATLRDLAAMVEDELRVASKVTVDDLTQVANRRGFKLVASHLLSLCERTNAQAELLYFDLDGFKAINDDHGHAAGDEILQHFATLLIKCFRHADVVARLGGDEFVVLLAGAPGGARKALERLETLAEATNCSIRQRLAWSVGCVQYDPGRHADVADLLIDADEQMYANKAVRQSSGPCRDAS